MKSMLSILSGRFSPLLVPAALVVSFLVPANAFSVKDMAIGTGGSGGSEGDPLDTNDYSGGGGGGSGTDVHDNTGSPITPDLLGLEIGRTQVLLVPQFVGGTLIFKIVIVDMEDIDLTAYGVEEIHAQ
jgi:hypothetical protein